MVGPEFPVVVRMNAGDHVSRGLNLWDAVPVAQALEEAGVDALSVTSGTMCEAVHCALYPAGTPKAHLPPFSAQIKAAVSLPVGVAGRIRRPDWAEEVLEADQADFIGLAGPLLADPDWPRKAQAGDSAAIALCASCHQGCLAELKRGTRHRVWSTRSPAVRPRSASSLRITPRR